jgi:phosphoglycerate dehydrogenase-like enzyme
LVGIRYTLEGFIVSATPHRARIISGLTLSDAQKAAIAATGAILLLDSAVDNEDHAARLAAEADVDVWFGPGLTPKVLKAGYALKWLQTASVGIEYFMYQELIESGIEVTNMRGRHTATAEHALALMLALARNLPALVDDQRTRRWGKLETSSALPLYDTHLLVVGTGQIGTGVATRAQGFRMTVNGVNRTGQVHPPFENIYPVAQLGTAVASADWIVSACPLTEETTNLFSEKIFASVKPGCVFVNVGRGKTVDESALLSALRDGRVRAAALDVFAQEPLAPDNPLWQLPNVLITPHAAGVIPNTEVTQLGVECLVANLVRYQNGGPLIDPVDKRRGY